MPRELLQIEKFNAGIIGTVDEQDIPNDAASFALETDADTLPGKLTPRYDDLAVADPVVENATTSAFIVNDDGTYDLVYHDAEEGDFTAVTDFYGTPSKSDLSSTQPGASATVAMQVHNKNVHIGWGNDSSSPAKWVGKISYKPFGDTTVSGLQYVDAELSPPQTIPHLYKLCGTDGTYIYGIEWKGSRLYRIKISDGTITESVELFTSTQGICEYKVNGSGDYLYLYDKDGPHGTLYKIDKTKIGTANTIIVETYHITGFGYYGKYPGVWSFTGDSSDKGYEVSDIELSTDTTIWFGAAWREDGDAAGAVDTEDSLPYNYDGYIFKLTGALVDGDSYIPSAVCPNFSSNSLKADGRFVSATAIFQPIKRCWVKTANRHTGEIVFLAQFNDGTGLSIDGVTYSDGKIYTKVDAGYSPVVYVDKYVGMAGIVLNGSTAQGDLMYSTNCMLFQISTNGTTHYTSAIQLYDSISGRTGYLMAGDGETVNAWYDGSTFDWSIAGAAWSTYVTPYPTTTHYFKTTTSVATQSEKFGNTRDTSICKTTNSLNSDSYAYWEHALDGVSRAITNTFDLSIPGFDASQAYPLYGFGLTATVYTDGRGAFPASKRFYYKASIEYDGLQESPLFVTAPTTATPASTDTVLLTVEIPVTLLPSYRATAVKIYRAESGTDQFVPSTFYRYVGAIPIADSLWSLDDNLWGARRLRTLADTGIYQAAYESETEISETMRVNYLNYKVSTQLQGFHFVTQAYSEFFGNTNTGNYLFRSKQNRFDQFDVANDFVVLPKRVNALAAFAGSIWAFADNEMYRVNPQGMFLEDIITGIGCNWSTGVCVTSEGMFWGDKNNIYQHNGQQIVPLGEAIKVIQNSNGSTYGYRSIVASVTAGYLSVVPFRKYGYILFCILQGSSAVSTATPYIYAYHLASGSWHIWTSSANNTYPAGVFSGKNGEVYLSVDAGLVSIAGDTSRKSMTWYSRDMTLDEASAKKSFVDLNIHNASGSNTTTVSFDDGAFASFTPLTRAKKMQIKVTGTGIIEAIGLVFRRLRGYTSANT